METTVTTAEVTSQAEKRAYVCAHFLECPEELQYSILFDAYNSLKSRRFSWIQQRLNWLRRQKEQ